MQPSALSLGIPLRDRIPPDSETETSQLDGIALLDSGRDRLARWRQRPPFADPSWFDRRLALLGVSEETLLRLLSEEGEHLAQRLPVPSWLNLWSRLANAPPRRPPLRLPSNREPALLSLLDVLRPLIEDYAAKLRQTLEGPAAGTASPVFRPSTVLDSLLALLVERLSPLVEKALVLELHVERLRGALRGNTAERRFESFVSLIGSDGFRRRFLSEYPVIARQAVLTCDYWLRFAQDFIRHLVENAPTLDRTLWRDAGGGRAVRVESAGGDPHRRGRVVLIVHPDRGGRPLVYKPRCLALESGFYSLLEEINRQRALPPFHLPQVLSFPDHGWMEFVEPKQCPDPAALQRYYQRFGALVAVAWALGASDLHYENIIAFGEHPVLVDLEALFQPTVESEARSGLGKLVTGEVEDSVLSTGLLPMRFFASRDGGGIDLSALTSDFDRFLPSLYPFWENVGTDEMSLAYAPGVLRSSSNTPRIEGREANFCDHLGTIVAGFEAACRLIQDRGEELRRPGGVLGRFEELQSRWIFRPTAIYGHLLQESHHPSLLRNAVDRDLYFDQLWQQAEFDPWLTRIIEEERRQLWDGDVPVFHGRIDTRDLTLADGSETKDFFSESGWEKHCRRIATLSPAQLERQKWFVAASLGSAADDPHVFHVKRRQEERTAALPGEGVQPEKSPGLVAMAEEIGRRLLELSLTDGRWIAWLSLTPSADGRLALHAANLDLYAGLPGILIFFSSLARVRQERRWADTSHRVFATLRELIRQRKADELPIGAFNGCGGILYALLVYGSTFPDASTSDLAEGLLERIARSLSRDDERDVIGGAAGCAICLLRFHAATGHARALDLAIACGDKLAADALPQGRGVGWKVKAMTGDRPLTGMAHGNAGIAWALFELARAVGRATYRELAERALEYERSLFSAEHANWPDLRPETGLREPDFVVGWCHGAAGIGLARLACRRLGADERVETEIDAALRTTLSHGHGHGHCLCHGDLGNLELLLQAGRDGRRGGLRDETSQWIAGIRSSRAVAGWLCGVPAAVETPGLMNGTAGMGLELLRLADPDAVPSVLLLEVPASVK